MLQTNKHLLSIASKLPLWRSTAALSNSPSINPKSPTALGEVSDNKADEVKDKTLKVKEADKLERKTPEDATSVLLSKITPEKNINFLLNIAYEPGLTVQLGTQILSIITNKINSGEAKVRDIFTDKRFLKLQEIILQNDMSTQDAAKLIMKESKPSIPDFSEHSTSSLVMTMKQLVIQKKRNLPILLALATHISEEDRALSVRQCTDILYTMAVLTFYHENMMAKVAESLLRALPTFDDKKIISAALTSLGILRYKHSELLNALYDKAVLTNPCFISNSITAIQTAATLGYTSETVKIYAQNISSLYKKADFTNLSMWVDFVWSLVALNLATETHLSSVLDESPKQLQDLPISKKMKLLNINGAASVLPDYKGRLLSEEEIAALNVKLIRSNIQEQRVQSLSRILELTMPSREYFTTNIDTNMGFYLDAECHYNEKGNPVELDAQNVENLEIRRIGIMLHSFNDTCLGPDRTLTGQVQLYTKLLKSKNYTVLSIPYEHYSLEDNAEFQQKYLKKRIQETLSEIA